MTGDHDEGWDLSSLLDAPAVPEGGAQGAIRAVQRRKVRRAVGAVVVVVLVVGGISAVALPGGRSSSRVTVRSQQPAPLSVVPGRPPAAGPDSSPFDWGSIRVWLPASWSPGYGEACNQPMAGDTVNYSGYERSITLTPCAPVNDDLTVTPASEGAAPTGSPPRSETINGLAAWMVTAPGFPSGEVTVLTVPALRARVTAQGAGAVALLNTLQPSAAYLLAQRASTGSAPTGWRPVVYDGLAFAVPNPWAVDDPSDPCNPPDRSLQLGLPTSAPGCPLAMSAADAPFPLVDQVRVVPSTGPASPDLLPVRTYRAGPLAVTVSISATRPPAVNLQIGDGARVLDFTVDVGADPTVAATILASIHPAAAGQADSIAPCTPTGGPPMPTPTRLTSTETMGGSLVLLDPPAPADRATVPASEAWPAPRPVAQRPTSCSSPGSPTPTDPIPVGAENPIHGLPNAPTLPTATRARPAST